MATKRHAEFAEALDLIKRRLAFLFTNGVAENGSKKPDVIAKTLFRTGRQAHGNQEGVGSAVALPVVVALTWGSRLGSSASRSSNTKQAPW